jgi:hypothetical protein
MMPHNLLRRIDFALTATSGDPGQDHPGTLAFQFSRQCRMCYQPLEPSVFTPVQWCPSCRSVYCSDEQRYLCELPAHWPEGRFLSYWHRGVMGRRESWSDRAFARFFCDHMGIEASHVAAAAQNPMPDHIRIGRLALVHRLLSRDDLAWILKFQRCSRPHRRRCFGEIAASLGYWAKEVNACILVAQAERRRGLVPAIAAQFNVLPERVLLAEREFFGLDAACAGGQPSWLDMLMAA